MQAAKRVAKNTGILYARMGITMFISLYATRIILNALGAEDFGIYNVIGGAIAMLCFLNASMAASTQRFMSYEQGAGNESRLKEIFNISVVMHFVVALVLFLLLEIAGYFIFKGVLNISETRVYAAKWIYQFMVISTLFTVVSVPYDAAINTHENMLVFAVLGIVESIAKLGIAITIMKMSGDKLIVYGILMAALSVFLLLLRAFYCQKKYNECKIRILPKYDKQLIKEMYSFAGWSFLGTSTGMIANYGQGIIINIFFGTLVNAAQGIASQISGQLSAFAVTMLKALNPTIDKSEGAGNRELMVKVSMTGSKISFFLLMLFYIPVLIEMPFILQIWLKHVPPFAIIFCQLLLVRNLVEQLFVTLWSSISAVGKIKRFQLFASVFTFFPLLITYMLFYKGYPPQTLYVVFLVYSILSSFNILYFSSKVFGLPIIMYLKEVVSRCLIAFLLVVVISFVPNIFMSEGFIRLVSVLLISFLSFLFFVWHVGFTKDEKTIIHQITNTGLSSVFLLRKRVKRRISSIN